MNDYNLAKKKLESGITDYKDFFKENASAAFILCKGD